MACSTFLAILSLILLQFVAAQCPANDGSWIEVTSLTTGTTITFDDLGFSSNPGWVSSSDALTIYNAEGRTVVMDGASGYANVFLGGAQLSTDSTWSGLQDWLGTTGKPGYFFCSSMSGGNYAEMNFSLPIAMFSMKINGKPETLSSSRIEAYDAEGQLIGCVDNIVLNPGMNGFAYRGISASASISRLVFLGITCQDELVFSASLCASESCDSNAWCFNDDINVGMTKCSCKPGFEGDGTPGNCTDVNECDDDPCGANALCSNLPASFNCTCKAGFIGDAYDNCTDIIECDVDPCSANATCANFDGGFNCTCVQGYTGDGLTCTEANECDDNPCDANANCVNEEGSYTCECDDGYDGNGTTCTMISTPESSAPGSTTPSTATTPQTGGKVSRASRSTVISLAAIFVAYLLM